MPHTSCAHCGTDIKDHTTMQEYRGETYCCRNCVAMATAENSAALGGKRCAHCESAIMDESTMVERAGQAFCCNNCAIAVADGVPHTRR
jgi:hypothetical protein